MLIRTWWRALAGAGGATLLVPLGLVAAIAVAATIGGASLGGLGQVFAGPMLPGGASGVTGATGTTTVAGPRGASGAQADREPNASTDVPVVPVSGPRRRTAGAPERRARRTPPRDAEPKTTGRPSRPNPAPVTSTPTSPPGGSPAAGSTGETNVVRRTTKALTDTVRPVAPVLTEPTADAVDSVVDLLVPPGTP